jgi:hypothetical protein
MTAGGLESQQNHEVSMGDKSGREWAKKYVARSVIEVFRYHKIARKSKFKTFGKDCKNMQKMVDAPGNKNLISLMSGEL